MRSKLALLGGKKVRSRPFPAYNTIGDEEMQAARKVLRQGVLSDFVAKWSDKFYGGKTVRNFEAAWKKKCNARFAVSMNSATSCLFAAAGAVEIGPGDEVIVSPWTMSATATAILAFNAVPVFADIQDDIFTLDPAAVEKKITPQTKAIFVTHIFGHPADMDPIMDLARRYNLRVVEDCAQAPFAKYKGKDVGSFGDVGVFSLNFHKHIHTGEGGVAVARDEQVYEKLLLIRNHGEIAATAKNMDNIINILGFNFRLTEIQAAIGSAQLKKFDRLQKARVKNAEYIAGKLRQLPGIIPPVVYDTCEHAFYVQPFTYDEKIVGVGRNRFVDAVRAELPVTRHRETQGPLLFNGYINPLYLQKVYQEKKLYGDTGCPFSCPYYKGKAVYARGQCRVTERLHEREFFYHEMFRPPMTEKDLDDVVNAFYKVYALREQLL